MASGEGNNQQFRKVIRLESEDSASDWIALLKELQEADGGGAAKKEAAGDIKEETLPDPETDTAELTDEAAEKRRAARKRYEKLCKTPSMRMEKADMLVLSDFSDVIAGVNEAGKALGTLHKKHPGYLPEHIAYTCRENLKETATVMLKEFHALRHGRQQKKYDKRYVCAECHHIFMVPLPSDGICDKCRAAKAPRSAPY